MNNLTAVEIKETLLRLSRDAGDRFFDPVTRLCLIPRDTVWYAIALLHSEDPAQTKLGISLLEEIQSEDGTHTPATMLAILHSIPDKLSEKAKVNLLENIARELLHAAEVEWHDGNVNHPLGAWCTLICGGEMSGQMWAVELGVRRLRMFRRTIGDRHHTQRRQAEMSEYNSLTYTALDLWFLAIIAEYAEHTRARTVARFLEERLWIDAAMHYHAPSQQFAGPHSRSYQCDSTGGYSAMHCTMLAAFRNELFLHPILAEQFHHPSDLIENSLIALLTFHVPDFARSIALEKRYPYYFRKTTYCEQYHENSRIKAPDGSSLFTFDDEVYAGGWRELTTYMTGEYALGSASLPYVNAGHADSFMLRIRRNEKIAHMADIRSIYTRGVFNASVVGRKNFCHVTQGEIDESYLYEEGRCAVYQHHEKAIVCYAPKRIGHKRVRSFRLDILCSYHAPFDSISIDHELMTSFPDVLPRARVICLQDYNTFIAIYPLTLSPVAENHLRFRTANDHLCISLYNYDGEEKDFAREEMSAWRNGFAIECATRDRFRSFAHFAEYACDNRVEEEMDSAQNHLVRFRTGDDEMRFVYNASSERIISQHHNGMEEVCGHISVEEAGSTSGAHCPQSLFGYELLT